MKTTINFFHPFGLLFYDGPRNPPRDYSDDTHRYGFSLDLTTELYLYTYDWGWGINFRILGFGFEIARFG